MSLDFAAICAASKRLRNSSNSICPDLSSSAFCNINCTLASLRPFPRKYLRSSTSSMAPFLFSSIMSKSTRASSASLMALSSRRDPSMIVRKSSKFSLRRFIISSPKNRSSDVSCRKDATASSIFSVIPQSCRANSVNSVQLMYLCVLALSRTSSRSWTHDLGKGSRKPLVVSAASTTAFRS